MGTSTTYYHNFAKYSHTVLVVRIILSYNSDFNNRRGRRASDNRNTSQILPVAKDRQLELALFLR